MSLDRSLKTHGGMARARSVLPRAERIARMVDEEKFDPEKNSPLGLPKTRVRHSKAGTKAKKAAAEAVEGAVPAEGAAPAAAAPAAEGKPAAKAAAKPGAAKPAAKAAAKPGGKKEK